MEAYDTDLRIVGDNDTLFFGVWVMTPLPVVDSRPEGTGRAGR